MTSAADYVAHGWALVPIPDGLKGPSGPGTTGWNKRKRCVVPANWAGNIGLAHAYSGTCAIDIDDVNAAREWLRPHGVDLDEWLKAPDAVLISSGRPNRAKLLYRLAEPLPSKKIIETVETSDGPLKQNIIDFRCSNAKGTTVQDVLPPSVHPDTGKPYEWVYGDDLVGDWRYLPEIPAVLLAVWRSLIDRVKPVNEGDSDRPQPVDLADLRAILEHEDANTDRDAWVRVLAMIHWETQGSDEGLALACEWSASGSDKFVSDEDVETRWRSFSLNTPNPVTAASYRVYEPATDDDFEIIAPVTEEPHDNNRAVTVPRSALPALKFDSDENGLIYASKENMRLALGRSDWCGTRLVLDTFRDDIMLAPHGTEDLRPLKDTDYERLAIWLEFNGFKTISHENMRRTVALVADDEQIDSAQQWLESLEWDGVPRVERFLTDYFAAGDSPYVHAVSLYWWTAHAGRVLEPGCKADMVPILVGEQGIGKSTGVAAIAPAPENFVEVRLDQEDEEIARRIRGCLVAEIGELRGLQSREAESIKSMIVATHDRWTPKYVERAHTVARRLVFVGTTNSEEFLADETGNRRWLPVRVHKVRVAAIGADRLQLWAEARDLWKVTGIMYGDAETLARDEHGSYMVTDVWQEYAEPWIDGTMLDDLGGTTPPRRETAFSTSEILVGALGFDPLKITKTDERRMGKILRGLGFTSRTVRNGKQARRLWVTDVTDTAS